MANTNENMTREEREVAIEKLKADIKYWENTSVSTDHLHMAIKALEQESILDKIRAEIEQLPITDTAIRLIGDIIDKHQAEVRGREDPCETAANREEEDFTR